MSGCDEVSSMSGCVRVRLFALSAFIWSHCVTAELLVRDQPFPSSAAQHRERETEVEAALLEKTNPATLLVLLLLILMLLLLLSSLVYVQARQVYFSNSKCFISEQREDSWRNTNTKQSKETTERKLN